MCGIVGMVGAIGTSEEKMFRDMWMMDTIRGWDSSGVVMVKKDTAQVTPGLSRVVTEKEVGTPDNLYGWGQSQIFNTRGILKGLTKCLIGHNRAATIGAINVDTAHPFTFGKIHGVHNGTLRDYMDLDGYKNFDVDSQVLFNHIHLHGVEDAWKTFTGAAAIVWWDEDTNQLNIVRNDERPLFQAFSKDGRTMFFASETWMIESAAKRQKVELHKRDDTDAIDFCYFATDYHYMYDVTDTGVKRAGGKKLEKKPPYKPTTPVGGNRGATQITYTKPKNIHIPKVKKSKKQLNQGWAADLEKADKDSRNLLIDIKHFNMDPSTLQAEFVSSKFKGPITVFCHCEEHREKIRQHISKGETRFKTVARMRFKIEGDKTIWGVSSAGIVAHLTVVENKKDSEVKDQPEKKQQESKFIVSYQNLYLPRKDWLKTYDTCAYCGGTPDPEHAKDIGFISKDQCICHDCMDKYEETELRAFGFK